MTISQTLFTLTEFFSSEFRSTESLNVVGIGLEQKLPFYIFYFNIVISTLIKFSIILGFFYVFLKNKDYNFDPYLPAISLSSIIFFGMFIILPFISTAYSLGRILLQLLIFLAIFAVIGSKVLFQKTKIGNIFVYFIFLVNFLFQTGFIGHYYGIRTIQLDNYGDAFERFTVSEEEIMSSKFLSYLDLKKIPIFADRYASLRLYGFGMIPYIGALKYHYMHVLTSRSQIDEGYVYLGYYNVKMEKIKEWSAREKEVVDQNMDNIIKMLYSFDKIYDNGGSQIWIR
jgi:uncharacterized membrane protein